MNPHRFTVPESALAGKTSGIVLLRDAPGTRPSARARRGAIHEPTRMTTDRCPTQGSSSYELPGPMRSLCRVEGAERLRCLFLDGSRCVAWWAEGRQFSPSIHSMWRAIFGRSTLTLAASERDGRSTRIGTCIRFRLDGCSRSAVAVPRDKSRPTAVAPAHAWTRTTAAKRCSPNAVTGGSTPAGYGAVWPSRTPVRQLSTARTGRLSDAGPANRACEQSSPVPYCRSARLWLSAIGPVIAEGCGRSHSRRT